MFDFLSRLLARHPATARAAAEAARRAQVEAPLRRRREPVRAPLASIADAVIVPAPAGRVTYLTPAAEKLTEWPAAEAAGRPVDDVFRLVHEGRDEPAESPAGRVRPDRSAVG